MSKIFDALNRGQSEIAELILPLIEAQQAPAPTPDNARQPDGESDMLPGRRPVAPPPPNPPIKETFPARLRTVRLHVAGLSPILPFEDSQRHVNEQYRMLRTKICQHRKQPSVLVISSPSPQDGKSVSAINTAGALSLKTDAKVLLVDADFRRSSIHIQLGIPATPGLADVLSGTCSVEQAITQTEEFSNLYVLTAGTPLANPAELLDGRRWPELCARLRGLFRYVVVDSPPVAAVADYDLIQAVSDSIILVVRPDQTNRALCQKALETIPKEKFLGVVMNCVPDWFLTRTTSAYYYYSEESGRTNP